MREKEKNRAETKRADKKRISLSRTALRLLYPPRCPICDCLLPVNAGRICPDCERKLPWVAEPACMKCGKPLDLPEQEYCEDCLRGRHLFDQGRAAFCYTKDLRHSIYRMKAENRRDYLDFYAEAMAAAGERHLSVWRPELIVPIPMHPKKRAARGYDQAALLAEKIGKLTDIPVDSSYLRCLRFTGAQKELDRRGRMQNLRGSFAAPRPDSAVNRVLLIDDVYTTGSTMDEASRALREAGAGRVFFLTLCTGKGKKRLHGPESVLY